MIDRSEIEEKSKRFEIDTSNVQRDYVFGWFLYFLFTESKLKELLFLKGGNALRKGYFENTRYSSDLDFGMETDIDSGLLQSEINVICDLAQAQTGIVFEKDQNSIQEKFTPGEDWKTALKVYEVKICFKDFYGIPSKFRLKIKMDITRFDRVYLPLQNRPLIHPYSDFQATLGGTIKCLKLEEIIGTKLKCLLQREHPPDLFDYVYSIFFNNQLSLDKSEVVSVFLKKTIFEPSPGVAKSILLTLPWDFFKRHWYNNIICAKLFFFDVDTAIEKFRLGIEEMFTGFSENGYFDNYFFPAQFRHPIIQAGRSQTLLKVGYNGIERLIEPYSLKYMQPRDKHAKEYLYAYDTTGGLKGNIGIKMFVPENMERIENTDTKFKPRNGHVIELAKAGEPVEDKYLYDPSKSARPQNVPSPRIRINKQKKYSGMKYTYQCSACYKKITKRSMDSSIGSHKNKYGGDCYGRYGVFIGQKF